MKITLLKADDLSLIDHAASECYNTEPKKTIDDSLLEFGSAVYEIEASAKTLLQMTRHRHASYACKSTRFTLNRSELIFERTGDPEIDLQLSKWKNTILDMIDLGKKNDVVSMMLPMAYQYRWQVQFNYRSLQNFLKLRLDKHAQYEIQQVAQHMLELLPKEIQNLMINSSTNKENK